MPSAPDSERLSTGRRHIRAGSVHVTELIRQRPCRSTRPFPVEAYPSASPEDGTLDTLLDLDDQPPNSHRRPPSTATQVAKIVSLGVASVLLCGSILIGSMISHRRQEAATATARPEVDISGEQALLPDLLDRAVPKSGVAAGPALPGPATRATGVIENPGPASAPAAEPGPAPAAGHDASPAPEEPLPKTDFVERFYRLIPEQPDQAFAFLDGTLLGTDLLEFERSWSDVSDIQVEARDQGDNVLALVRLRLPDGSHLQVQQLVYVTDTVPQRITGAHILFAQRT